MSISRARGLNCALTSFNYENYMPYASFVVIFVFGLWKHLSYQVDKCNLADWKDIMLLLSVIIIRVLIVCIGWQSYIVHVMAFQRWSTWHQTCRHTRILHCGPVPLPSKRRLCQTPTGRLALPSPLINRHRSTRKARNGLWWVSLLGINTEIVRLVMHQLNKVKLR